MTQAIVTIALNTTLTPTSTDGSVGLMPKSMAAIHRLIEMAPTDARQESEARGAHSLTVERRAPSASRTPISHRRSETE